MNTDLTIIFLTANRVPKQWAAFHKEKLLEAAAGKPIITISREPLDWGTNVLQTEKYGASNIYWQLRRRHYKNLLEKYSWVALLLIAGLALWTCQKVWALQTLQTRPIITL